MLCSLGSQVAVLRRDCGISRSRLAELAECHPNSLASFERGTSDPSAALFSRIVSLLDCGVVGIGDSRIVLERCPGSPTPGILREMSQRRMAAVMGKAIRSRREHLGLSLEELSDASGLHRNTISQLELSDTLPSTATLFRLFKGLRISRVSMDGQRVALSPHPSRG